MNRMATVLVVEDEFAIAELLAMVLIDEGYTVVTAANGRQGMDLLTGGLLPDLIITDFMMPIVDGIGFLKQIDDSKMGYAIPCVIMSSVPEENVRDRIPTYSAFVRKPFQLSKVVDLIATLISAARSPPSRG
jgi:CheY-like chemotaxis protein